MDSEPTEEIFLLGPRPGADSGICDDAANSYPVYPEVTQPVVHRAATAAPGADRAVRQIKPSPTGIAGDEDSRELIRLPPNSEPEQRLESSDLMPGATIANRYVIAERVSHRGMGVLYKALDQRRESAGSPVPWVALKFAGSAGEGRAGSDHLCQEFLKLSQLSHPNIVSVFDFDNHQGLDFLVMEWLEGETLSALLTRVKSKRIAFEKAQEIVRSVGAALAHAHVNGIVHGDVKPSNIFLTENRSVKLLDFGSSGSATAEGEAKLHWATRAYASCEVLRGAAPQPSDDVFALGVTAYCLFSGERPFGDVDAQDACKQNRVPQPLPADARHVWPAIAHALELTSLSRPADAGDFLLEFEEEGGDTQPPERDQIQHIAYGAVAVVLLLTLVAWTVNSLDGAAPNLEQALEHAQLAVADGRLMHPDDGSSAYSLYSSVLKLDPDNSEARKGLDRIAETYLTRARAALSAGDLDSAVAQLAVTRRVAPGHYGVAITEDLIARYGRDLLVEARRALPTDPAKARLLLSRAEDVLPAGDAGLEEMRVELEDVRLNERLESLLGGIDQRILSERLTVPDGDSAVDLLHQARRIAPGNRQVEIAADRIATALLFQSIFSASNGDLGDAQTFIDAAKALNVRHLALARAEYELAKARRDQVRRN